MNACVATAPTPGSAQATELPTENQCDWTATPICPVAESTATMEKVCAGRPGNSWAARAAGTMSRAARPRAMVTMGSVCTAIGGAASTSYLDGTVSDPTRPASPRHTGAEKRAALPRELADFLIEFSIALH